MLMAGLADWLRSDVLVTSGGWLGDIVPPISNALRIWDTFVLAGIFIIAWVVLRVSDSLTSMILGFTFDITIPLQHYMNPNLLPQHQAHLDSYWPILTFGTGIELLCFFVVHPDLFTLVVCLKTTIMTAIWLGRRADGTYLTTAIGARTGSTTAAGKPKKTDSSTPVSESPEKRWDRKLKDAGYDDVEGRKGMIDYLKSLKDPKKQEAQLAKWLKDKDAKSRKKTMDKYKKSAKSSKGTPEDWDKKLKAAGYDDPEARKKMVEWLKTLDPREAEKKLKAWEGEKDPKKKAQTMAKFNKKKDAGAGAGAGAAGAPTASDNGAFVDPNTFEGDLQPQYMPYKLGRQGGGPGARGGPGGLGGLGASGQSGIPGVTPIPNSDGSIPPGVQELHGQSAFRPGRGGNGPAELGGRPAGVNNGPAELDGRSAAQPVKLSFLDRIRGKKPKPPDPLPPAKRVLRRAPIRDEFPHPAEGSHSNIGEHSRIPRQAAYIDETDGKYQSGISRSARENDIWENALPHDSLELIDYYLREGRLDYEVRGQMLFDLMCQVDPRSVVKMVDSWKRAYDGDEWDEVIEPYYDYPWKPARGNSYWQGGDLVRHGGREKGELDDFLWSLRRAGFSPASRRSMVRGLMSQDSEAGYKKLKSDILAVVNADADNSFIPRDQLQKAKKDLEQSWEQINGIGRSVWFASEEEVAGVAKHLDGRAYSPSNIQRQLNKIRRLKEKPPNFELWKEGRG